ncbi:MAG: DNA cytosine methyltransferase [Candidatus Polarisedimenticolaceae bacterium]|nr:DNA cytosine methyltransferase [Candidatus Polarisedimenticolaceae bacterium]
MKKLPVISLFSGAMGLDIGLEQAGFEVCVAVECDKDAANTIRLNKPNLPVINKRIEDITTEEILSSAGLKVGEACLVVGGPSCQAYSTAGSRHSFADTDKRGTLFRHFLRVVREAKPSFFVMENVKGILSAAIKHRPLKERGPTYPPLRWEEQLGSAFTVIAQELSALGGNITFDLLNSADYGVPQKRERVIFIGSLAGSKVMMPKPTHSKDPTNSTTPWQCLRAALSDINEPHEYADCNKNVKQFLSKIPPGGNWRNLPSEEQENAVGPGVYRSWGGRTGFLRRLSWDAPSPALTTSPLSKATFFGHPKELRPLSIQEYARIQQFPDSWIFTGSKSSRYRQIGNAVPVGLGRAIGLAVKQSLSNAIKADDRSKITCHNKQLMTRLCKRKVTYFNPPDMHGITCSLQANEWIAESKTWLDNREKPTLDLLSFLEFEPS